LVPYVRQSRAKEKTISLEEQRRTIHAWAKKNRVELAQEIVEQGVSGSKAWRSRALGAAVTAVEDGEAQGIIVAFQDRLSRENGLATAEVWQALEKAEARLVCAGEGLDTSTGDHEMLFTIKAAIAREQWKRHRVNWEGARRNAVERGIHVSSTLPAGYDRDPETKRLVPNNDAPAITRAFEARVKGASWTQLAKLLNEAGVRTSHAGRKSKLGNGTTEGLWSPVAVSRTLANPVYRGQARSGDFLLEDAHEPLVSKGLWSRVQGLRQKGDFAREREVTLVTGLVRCASCGSSMRRDTTRRGGKVYPFLRCKNALCQDRPSIGLNRLSEYIEDNLLRLFAETPELALRFSSPVYQPAGDDQHLVDALLAAEEELKLYAETTSISDIGAEAFKAGLEARKGKIEEARQAVAGTTPSQWPPVEWAELEPLVGDVIKPQRDGTVVLEGDAILAWWRTLNLQAKRDIIANLITIEVKPGRAPVEERVKAQPRQERS